MLLVEGCGKVSNAHGEDENDRETSQSEDPESDEHE